MHPEADGTLAGLGWANQSSKANAALDFRQELLHPGHSPASGIRTVQPVLLHTVSLVSLVSMVGRKTSDSSSNSDGLHPLAIRVPRKELHVTSESSSRVRQGLLRRSFYRPQLDGPRDECGQGSLGRRLKPVRIDPR